MPLNEQYRRLLNGQPVTPATRDPSQVTAQKFNGLTYPELVTLRQNNPDEYNRLMGKIFEDSAFD